MQMQVLFLYKKPAVSIQGLSYALLALPLRFLPEATRHFPHQHSGTAINGISCTDRTHHVSLLHFLPQSPLTVPSAKQFLPEKKNHASFYRLSASLLMTGSKTYEISTSFLENAL